MKQLLYKHAVILIAIKTSTLAKLWSLAIITEISDCWRSFGLGPFCMKDYFPYNLIVHWFLLGTWIIISFRGEFLMPSISTHSWKTCEFLCHNHMTSRVKHTLCSNSRLYEANWVILIYGFVLFTGILKGMHSSQVLNQ